MDRVKFFESTKFSELEKMINQFIKTLHVIYRDVEYEIKFIVIPNCFRTLFYAAIYYNGSSPKF